MLIDLPGVFYCGNSPEALPYNLLLAYGANAAMRITFVNQPAWLLVYTLLVLNHYFTCHRCIAPTYGQANR
jgi:hypothetical protein